MSSPSSNLAPLPSLQFHPQDVAEWSVSAALRSLTTLLISPSLLFLLTLTAMLFRPPEVKFFALDRVLFGALLFTTVVRGCAVRRLPNIFGRVTVPMLLLTLLAFSAVLAQPYEAETWSLFAAKWAVPFALFHLAGLVFSDGRSLQRFETFAVITLAYLSFTAIMFLIGANELVFPRYILDESLGIHADRARGPFLQAVANGLTLNLLALIALNSFRRGRLRGALAATFFVAVPIALVATKTRAVWLSVAASVVAVILFGGSARLRRVCLTLCLLAGSLLSGVIAFSRTDGSLSDRLGDSSPLEYRMAVYEAGWQMFLEKPLLGWGPENVQSELWRRVTGFHVTDFYFHNTYLEVTAERGLLGLGLYVWLIVDLLRLGKKNFVIDDGDVSFLDRQFCALWPIMLFVYFLNACFVGMNYQFVNGLLFSIAGMLAAQNRVAARASAPSECHRQVL